MSDFDHEPVRGLPAALPAGERILWQGTPDWRLLARTAFRTPLVAGYFALLCVAAAASGHPGGVAATLIACAAGIGVLMLLAWAVAQSSVYTLTNRRLVLRIGVALPKHVNLPLSAIAAADLKPLGHGRGDIALRLAGPAPLPYLMLWPHARPWRVARPEPALRALPDAEAAAALLARACAELVAIERRAVAVGSRPAANAPAGTAEAAA